MLKGRKAFPHISRTGHANSAGLVVKPVIYKVAKPVESLYLVNPVGNKRDGCALDNPKRKHAEKAFRVYAAVVFFNPDRAFI